ncbi:MAG TPA: DUF3090 family protein [Acidimicrobiia bacterium]|nr:DUF3090 family protein [Acidimicrobiia bacterium]
MGDPIELDPVDSLGAGAVGEPGRRTFLIQAAKSDARLTVLVEKEQIELLAREAMVFLERIAEEFPEDPVELGPDLRRAASVDEPAVPLFRARLIGLGFEPERELVLIELRERSEGDEADEGDEAVPDGSEADGFIARLFATRAQVRAMAARAVEAVTAGRPKCPLCDLPMDPQGHRCPRWN